MFLNHRIAVITSQFNQEITDLLQEGALDQFAQRGNPIDGRDIFRVPGAVEIPVVAASLAKKEIYEAIVCLGAVIQGETTHYDYVCQQISYGCQKIALTYYVPVIFGILTTDNEQQALDRCGGAHGHKGRDCADAALEMIRVMGKVEAL